MLIYISFLMRYMANEIVAPIHFSVILHRIRNFTSVQFTHVDTFSRFYKCFRHIICCMKALNCVSKMY